MFQKRFEAIDIFVDPDSHGNICIFLKQPDPYQEYPSIISISPDQVDSVIETLKQARDSIDQN